MKIRINPGHAAWRAIVAMLALPCLGTAQAAIAPGRTGDAELLFAIHDPVAQVSYTLDLGVRMSEFFIWGQPDEGVQRFWTVDDDNWTSFVAQTSGANHAWAVLAADSAGPVTGAQQRLFSTAKQGQENLITTTVNNSLRSGIASSAAINNFYNAVNITGTHAPELDYTVNGSSVNAIADPGFSYFGESGGTGPRLQANSLPYSMMNAPGESSWFYSVGSTAASGAVGAAGVDEFDNLSHDGYWGFIYVDPALYPSSPYVGKYLLSYTLEPALVQARVATIAGQRRAALTEFQVGTGITRHVAAPDGEFAGYVAPTASLISMGPVALAPVPEPGAWWMGAAGLAALSAWRRRRDRHGV
jgi:MYXO-CTERM domain-containing protein